MSFLTVVSSVGSFFKGKSGDTKSGVIPKVGGTIGGFFDKVGNFVKKLGSAFKPGTMEEQIQPKQVSKGLFDFNKYDSNGKIIGTNSTKQIAVFGGGAALIAGIIYFFTRKKSRR